MAIRGYISVTSHLMILFLGLHRENPEEAWGTSYKVAILSYHLEEETPGNKGGVVVYKDVLWDAYPAEQEDQSNAPRGGFRQEHSLKYWVK